MTGGRISGRKRKTYRSRGGRAFNAADLRQQVNRLRPTNERSTSSALYRDEDGYFTLPKTPVNLPDWRKPGSPEHDRMIDTTPTKRRSRLGKLYDSIKKRYAKLTRSLRKNRSKKKYASEKYFRDPIHRSRETEYAKQDLAEMDILKKLDNPNLDPDLRAVYKKKTSRLGRVEPHAQREARLERERIARETAI